MQSGGRRSCQQIRRCPRHQYQQNRSCHHHGSPIKRRAIQNPGEECGYKVSRNRKRQSQSAVTIRRHPVSLLSDIAYFEKPMPRELAETIRTLRRDHKLSYTDLMWALSETDPDIGHCFGFGRALTERAAIELNDDNPSWK